MPDPSRVEEPNIVNCGVADISPLPVIADFPPLNTTPEDVNSPLFSSNVDPANCNVPFAVTVPEFNSKVAPATAALPATPIVPLACRAESAA